MRKERRHIKRGDIYKKKTYTKKEQTWKKYINKVEIYKLKRDMRKSDK